MATDRGREWRSLVPRLDALSEEDSNPMRDSSVGAIAVNGMLVHSQAIAAGGEVDLLTRFLDAACAELVPAYGRTGRARMYRG